MKYCLFIIISIVISCNSSQDSGSIDNTRTIPTAPLGLKVNCKNLNFNIDDKDLLYVDGELIQSKHIHSKILNFLKLYGNEDVCLNISNNRQTSYSYYLDVRKEVTEALNLHKNIKAKQLFDKSFDQLNEEEQEMILNERKILLDQN